MPTHRPKRKGIQLAYPFSEERLLNKGRYPWKWSPPYILQPKFNGERCRMIVVPGRCLLLSSTEELITSCPHINRAGMNFPVGEYDGELYVHGWTWAEIHSVVSTTTSMHSRAEEMQLHFFDLISEDTQINRLIKLSKIVYQQPKRDIFFYANPSVAYTLEEIYSIYDRYIGEGYEGFIIRHADAPYTTKRAGWMMKFKPKQKDHYRIIKCYEAISEDGTPKGILGGFTCIDDMSTYFNVGAGKLTHDERKELWEMYSQSGSVGGDLLEVEYQTLSDKNKVPLFSRAVRILQP